MTLLARWTKKSVEEVVEWIREKFAAELDALDEEACARCDAHLKYLDPSSDEWGSVDEEESVDEDGSESEGSSSEESTSEESSSESSLPVKRKAGVRLSFLHSNVKFFKSVSRKKEKAKS